ncbi:MAG: MurNAc alpha-1-phosphate uridylyltransferase [Candidatus Endobugula sp.]|jgi:MurNAc alpha-1-phosphate uridylyltransferase
MKAMILAAGRGERMRPLTDTIPKPLLSVANKPLIVYHLEKIAAMEITEVVINIAYLGDKIRQALGDGSRWGLTIQYSEETEPLETAGALLHALPLLGDTPFLLVNGDVWTDLNFSSVVDVPLNDALARLVFVKNPEHNLQGDFYINENNLVEQSTSRLSNTFGGVALISPKIISGYPNKRRIFPLKEVFDYYIEQQLLEGIVYSGKWCDVGTPARLASLGAFLLTA